MKSLLLIGLGGALGAISRYGIAQWLKSEHFPLATLLVNILGSLLIGIAYVLITERLIINEVWKGPLMIGFLGAFTTFSSFSLESIHLFESGQHITAISYMLISLLLCIFAAWLGISLGRFI